MHHMGVGGFNVIERAGICLWMKERYPQFNLERVVHSQDLVGKSCLVLDEKFFLTWRSQIGLTTPIILLSPKDKFDANQPNLTVVYIASGAKIAERKIENWIDSLEFSKTGDFSGKGEALKLTSREIEVLELLHQGATNEKIACAMNIKVPTVKTYLSRIYQRLGVSNRAHAVALYKLHQL